MAENLVSRGESLTPQPAVVVYAASAVDFFPVPRSTAVDVIKRQEPKMRLAAARAVSSAISLKRLSSNFVIELIGLVSTRIWTNSFSPSCLSLSVLLGPRFRVAFLANQVCALSVFILAGLAPAIVSILAGFLTIEFRERLCLLTPTTGLGFHKRSLPWH